MSVSSVLAREISPAVFFLLNFHIYTRKMKIILIMLKQELYVYRVCNMRVAVNTKKKEVRVKKEALATLACNAGCRRGSGDG